MTEVFFDLETSCLNPNTGCLVECAAVLIDDESNVVTKNFFHKRILLRDGAEISDEALEINHYSEVLWAKSAVSEDEGINQFNDWLKSVSNSEKPTIVGTNCGFDQDFLFAACDRHNISPYVDLAWLDMISFWVKFKKIKKLGKLGNSQATIIDHFGIKNDKAHSAIHDSITGAMAWCELMKRLKFD